MSIDLTVTNKTPPQSPPRPTVLNIVNSNNDDNNTQQQPQQHTTPKRKSKLSFEHDVIVNNSGVTRAPPTTEDDDVENETIHAFNNDCSNITVIETTNNCKQTELIDENNSKMTVTDGSDSGVELCGGPETLGGHEGREILQRALSNTSGGGYSSSSCGGADVAFSCDSSIVSCCSNYEDAFDMLATKNSSLLEDLSRHATASTRDERVSENGSESSSIAGSICGGRTPKSSLSSRRIQGINNTNTIKKKVAVAEPVRQSRNRITPTTTENSIQNTPRSRSKSNSSRINNSTKTPTNFSTNSLSKLRLKEKTPEPGSQNDHPQKSSTSTSTCSSTSTIPIKSTNKISTSQRSRPKTDLNIPKRDTSQTRSSSTNKLIKTRTPASTPSDDGRWPSTGSRPTPITIARAVRVASVGTHDPTIGNTPVVPLTNKTSRLTSLVHVESKASALEKYATLPRRRRERPPSDTCTPSSSKDPPTFPLTNRSRDTSLTRTPIPSRKQKDLLGGCKFLPPYPLKKKITKTKIYHETSSQTALTCDDVENALNGIATKPIVNPEDVEKVECGIQVDRRNEIVERLENQIKEIMEKNMKLLEQTKNQSQQIDEIEQQLKVEREEKQAAKDELERNAQRVLAMIQNNDQVTNDGCDSLFTLETQFKKAGEIVVKQEKEISELEALCRSLQRDLQKSLQTQETLVQQQKDMEAESSELKDFMQAEKTTLAEVLRDTEEDVRLYIHKLKQKDLELQRQQDECKHLVRVSEQRRQENLTLQARLGCIEARSRELLLQQGAAVSGAAVALSGLIGRLESLVTQLVNTYSISEQDLEDAIYHNEAYSNSESSDGSPVTSSESRRSKRTPSPKRGASFISAVISAIKNAAAQTAIRANSLTTVGYTDSEDTDSGELLDSETEPVLMMESVLEDVTLPDTHSHNMVSSCHNLMTSSRLAQSSESLHNLSQSILARQQLERSTATDKMTPSPACSLVDQIIDVDNMVTKLLKVLRIIQIENDAYIDELHEERNQMTEQIEKQQETCKAAVRQLQDWEQMGALLKTQLAETSKQLEAKTKELNDTKVDIVQQKKQIERLNEDICKLSMLCSQTELKLRSREEEANTTLKQWQETGKLPTADVLARLVTARHEIPALKEKLLEKEKELAEITEKFSTSKQVMTESWNQAISETRRQYEAIDSALETLISIQNVVEQCPPLSKLQHDLEEISFQCASSIPLVPLVASDFNANAAANHRLETASATPINGTA